MSKCKNLCRRILGFILAFGLIITMLSKGTEVFAATTEVKLNVNKIEVTKGGSYRLKVYNLGQNQSVVYRSDDTSVATVSATGKVSGRSCGTTYITATVVEGEDVIVSLRCDVLIGPAAVGIKFTKFELVLSVGMQRLLRTIIVPLNTVETPVFYSENLDIATISSAGRVRAKAVGTVQVYAFIENGQASICNVVVLSEEDYESYLAGMSLDELVKDNDADEAGENSANDEASAGNSVNVTENQNIVSGSAIAGITNLVSGK